MKYDKYSRERRAVPALRAIMRDYWLAGVFFAVIAIVLYLCYPEPYLTSDSGEYMNSAVRLANNPYRPLGYGLFLALVHTVFSSAQVIPFAQMLVYLLGLSYFVRQIHHTFALSRRTIMVLSILLVINPLPWLYTMHILSDSLFTTLTLCFVGSAVSYAHDAAPRTLMQMLIWAGLSLLVRHVGLLYMIFGAAVIIFKWKKNFFKPLIGFAAGCALVILLICFKMNADLGVFRLNTFDGWTLYGTAARYIDLSPEYRDRISSSELKQLYDYFASYPETTYTSHSRDWNQWSPDSPAKRLLFYYIQTYRMDYYQAWVVANDNLRQIATDIVFHRPSAYFMGSYLPALANGIWPDMILQEGGWPGYPFYPKPSPPDKTIQSYYHQNTETWNAQFDVFPVIKPMIDIWVKPLMPLFIIITITTVLRRGKLNLFAELPPVVVLGGFVVFYIVSVAATIYLYTRFLVPITSLLITLNVIGAVRAFQFQRNGYRPPIFSLNRRELVKNGKESQ